VIEKVIKTAEPEYIERLAQMAIDSQEYIFDLLIIDSTAWQNISLATM
jgi:hypothetical protein